MTIQQLIDALKPAESHWQISFGFPNSEPTTLAPLRGTLPIAALGWRDYDVYPESTVGEILSELLAALGGKTYKGIDGKTFVFSADTEVRIDNPWDCTWTFIESVDINDMEVIIQTKRETP